MSPLSTQPRLEGMRHDPEGAAQRSGLQLDDEDRRVLKSFDRPRRASPGACEQALWKGLLGGAGATSGRHRSGKQASLSMLFFLRIEPGRMFPQAGNW